jgi:hypothetical protein
MSHKHHKSKKRPGRKANEKYQEWAIARAGLLGDAESQKIDLNEIGPTMLSLSKWILIPTVILGLILIAKDLT